MVEVLPFRGLRYAPGLAGADVLAPPYDVIDEPAQRVLLARSPYNVVRLILGEPGAGPRWHAGAARALQHWQDDGVLVRDARPLLYGYQQTFRSPDGRLLTRSGLCACVRLSPWGDGVHRHEHTRSGPRADRLRLLRATDADLSPVFGLYRDPAGDLVRWLQPPERPSVHAIVDGVGEVFWPIEDPAALRAIPAALARRDVVIADGHHRYETALAYRDERNAALPGAPRDASARGRPWDYVLMVLVAAEDPGLLVLPTHRVITGAAAVDPQRLLRSLAEDFVTERVERGSLRDAAADAAESGSTVAMGLCLDGAGRWLLRLRDPAAALRHALPDQARIAALDVSVLQNLILGPRLGICPQALAGGDAVRYTISEDEACADVERGEARAAFVLNPPSVEQVWSAALAGATMPQKSTYFYPKLLTGLVIQPLSEPHMERTE